MSRRLSAMIALALLAIAIPASASGASPAPGFRVKSIAEPTNFSAKDIGCQGSCDSYLLTVTNSGSRPTDGSPITVVDTLPAGVTAEAATLSGLIARESHPCDISSPPTVRCTFEGRVLPTGCQLAGVDLGWDHTDPAARNATNSVEVSGGGASTVVVSAQNEISTAPVVPGLDGFSLELDGVNGGIDTQAGDHPFGITSTFEFASELTSPLSANRHKEHFPVRTTQSNLDFPAQEVKDVYADLPLGFVGNPQGPAQCTEAQLQTLENGTQRPECPEASQIGMIQLNEAGRIDASSAGGSADESYLSGIYNMVPEHGYPAEFGFEFAKVAIIIYARVVPSSNGYVLRVFTPGIVRFLGLTGISLTFWGVPEDSSHDVWRASQGLEPVGFLTNPTDCSVGPLSSTAFSDTWENPGSYLPDGQPNLSDPAWVQKTTTVYPSITGCELLQFTPTLSVLPSTSQADEPTGLSVDLGIPQAPQVPPYLMTPPLKNVSVTLPSGVSLSPSAGDGLQACSEEQIGLSSTSVGLCPDGSVLGTVQITTPLLAEPLEGHVFLGTPGCGQTGQGPCSEADAADGNMFRLYIEVAGSGVVVKVPGRAFVNTTTGQITSTFAEDPQLPFSDLKVTFKGGLRAPLATPQSCGTFTTTSDFTPWSSPISTPDATPSSSFNIDWDGNGGACVPGVPGLNPGFSAGTSNPNAGQFSPLTVTFSRQDRRTGPLRHPGADPSGLVGLPLWCPALRGAAGIAGDMWCGFEDRKHDCGRGSRATPVLRAGVPIPDGTIRWRAVRFEHRRADRCGTVQPRQRSRQGTYQRRSGHRRVDCYKRSATADHRRHPLAVAHSERHRGPSRLHLQPDELCPAAHFGDDHRSAGRTGTGLGAVRRGGLLGVAVRSEVQRVDLRAHLAAGRSRRASRREAPLPQRRLLEHSEGQGRPAEASASTPDDVAEGVPRGDLRREPRIVSQGLNRRHRTRDHTNTCRSHCLVLRISLLFTVAKRSRT